MKKKFEKKNFEKNFSLFGPGTLKSNLYQGTLSYEN